MERLGLFYVRFMDDVLVLAPTRWRLRKVLQGDFRGEIFETPVFRRAPHRVRSQHFNIGVSKAPESWVSRNFLETSRNFPLPE